MNEALFQKTTTFLTDASVPTALRLLSKPLDAPDPDEDRNWSGVIETMGLIRTVHAAGLRDPAVLAAFARYASNAEVVELFEAVPAQLAHEALTFALHRGLGAFTCSLSSSQASTLVTPEQTPTNESPVSSRASTPAPVSHGRTCR